MTELLTVGHGTLDSTGLVELLAGAAVDLLVDVRRYPASRRNPDVGRDALQSSLPAAGLGYRWAEDLGGRRHLPAGTGSLDPWWQVDAFRAYAAHTRTPAFAAALGAVLADAQGSRTAVMCSESVWWRCHRRLVADVSVLAHGVEVRHLMAGGRLSPHRPAAGARVREDGTVVWDRVDDRTVAARGARSPA